VRQENAIRHLEQELTSIGEDNELTKEAVEGLKKDLSAVQSQAKRSRSNLTRDKKELQESLGLARQEFQASYVLGLPPPPLSLDVNKKNTRANLPLLLYLPLSLANMTLCALPHIF
jgi:septal ring factor EnvC (AmiA/AmiB activator)